MAININDFSDGKEIQNSDGSYEWQGSKIFDKIMIAVNGNIKTEYDNGRITGAEYATVYLGALQSAIAEATKIVVNKELIDAQVAEQLDATNRAERKLADELLTTAKQRNQIDKQIEVENKQIEKITNDISIENSKLADELLTTAKQRNQIDKQILELTKNGVADRAIKAEQKALIVKQQTTEANKAALINRQKNAYNDKLRIEKAKALGNTVGMAWAGGTTVTNNLDNKLATAIDAIT